MSIDEPFRCNVCQGMEFTSREELISITEKSIHLPLYNEAKDYALLFILNIQTIMKLLFKDLGNQVKLKS